MTARGKPGGSPRAQLEPGQSSGASTAAASTTQNVTEANATAVAATAEPASPAASSTSTSTATAAQPSDTKPSGSRGHDAPAASSAPLGAGIRDMMEQLQSHLQLEQQKLEAREAHVQQQEARQKAEAARLVASGVRGQDVVELNVGGSIISTSRKTLCLVPDSLLEAMFSGRWEESCTKDEAGRVFLDLDPSLFETVLNWLRMFGVAGPTTDVPEAPVPAGKEEAFMVLVDYLQLNRYMPLRFDEKFSEQLHSPLVLINGAVATRLDPPKSALVQVASTAHSYFDVCVELVLRVTMFHSASSAGNFPMTIGFMAKDQLERTGLLSESKDAKVTWQRTFHGWLTCGQEGYAIINGQKQVRRCKDDYLWYPGDLLRVTLDCRKHLRQPRITLLNSMSKVQQEMAICLEPQPHFIRSRTRRRAIAARAAGTATDAAAAPAAAGAGAAAAPAAAVAGAAAGSEPAGTSGGRCGSADSHAACPREASSMEWVLVVALTHPEDEVSIVSARRRGMRPI